MSTALKAFWQDEQGNEIISWIMIAAVIAAAIVALFSTNLVEALSDAVSGIVSNIGAVP